MPKAWTTFKSMCTKNYVCTRVQFPFETKASATSPHYLIKSFITAANIFSPAHFYFLISCTSFEIKLEEFELCNLCSRVRWKRM